MASKMSILPPRRWNPRSLMVMFLPHLFRKIQHPQEAIGPLTEKVPLDANLNQYFINSKTDKMKKAMRINFQLTMKKPLDAPMNSAWSIATGEWVPEHELKLHYIFPFSLGPTIAKEVSGRIEWRAAENGMMVPRAIGQAFDEWSLLIAPGKYCHGQRIPESYVFQLLESEKKNLREPISNRSKLAVRDLHGERLHFRSAARLNPHSCYFQSCCAIWKSTFLEDPSRRPEEFWEQFQVRMSDIWATRHDRKRILRLFKPPELVKAEEAAGTDAKVEEALAVESEPEVEISGDRKVEDCSSVDGEAAENEPDRTEKPRRKRPSH